MSPPTVCVPNIGPRERMRRVRFGVASLAAGVLLGALLVALSVARPWRLVIFAPLWAGSIGIFQAREKTCVALVARGERNMDGGVETVTDPAELERLKVQARSVHQRSLILAAILSAIAIAAP
jgi:hypothetical protein